MKWLWLPARKRRDTDCLPALHADGLHLPPRHCLRSCIQPNAWTFNYGKQGGKPGFVSPSLTFMTFNVRTLREEAASDDAQPSNETFVPGRYSLLETQVYEAAVGILALQETRSKTSGSLSGPRFAKFEGGQGGMELWFNKDVPLCHGPRGPIYFQDKDIVVIHADPTSSLSSGHLAPIQPGSFGPPMRHTRAIRRTTSTSGGNNAMTFFENLDILAPSLVSWMQMLPLVASSRLRLDAFPQMRKTVMAFIYVNSCRTLTCSCQQPSKASTRGPP